MITPRDRIAHLLTLCALPVCLVAICLVASPDINLARAGIGIGVVYAAALSAVRQ